MCRNRNRQVLLFYGVVVIGIGSWSNVKELESKGIRVGKKQLDKSVFILNERVFCCCFLDVVFVFSGFSTRVGGAQEGAQQRAFHEWDGWRPEKGKLVRSGGGGQPHCQWQAQPRPAGLGIRLVFFRVFQ